MSERAKEVALISLLDSPGDKDSIESFSLLIMEDPLSSARLLAMLKGGRPLASLSVNIQSNVLRLLLSFEHFLSLDDNGDVDNILVSYISSLMHQSQSLAETSDVVNSLLGQAVCVLQSRMAAIHGLLYKYNASPLLEAGTSFKAGNHFQAQHLKSRYVNAKKTVDATLYYLSNFKEKKVNNHENNASEGFKWHRLYDEMLEEESRMHGGLIIEASKEFVSDWDLEIGTDSDMWQREHTDESSVQDEQKPVTAKNGKRKDQGDDNGEGSKEMRSSASPSSVEKKRHKTSYSFEDQPVHSEKELKHILDNGNVIRQQIIKINATAASTSERLLDIVSLNITKYLWKVFDVQLPTCTICQCLWTAQLWNCNDQLVLRTSQLIVNTISQTAAVSMKNLSPLNEQRLVIAFLVNAFLLKLRIQQDLVSRVFLKALEIFLPRYASLTCECVLARGICRWPSNAHINSALMKVLYNHKEGDILEENSDILYTSFSRNTALELLRRMARQPAMLTTSIGNASATKYADEALSVLTRSLFDHTKYMSATECAVYRDNSSILASQHVSSKGPVAYLGNNDDALLDDKVMRERREVSTHLAYINAMDAFLSPAVVLHEAYKRQTKRAKGGSKSKSKNSGDNEKQDKNNDVLLVKNGLDLSTTSHQMALFDIWSHSDESVCYSMFDVLGYDPSLRATQSDDRTSTGFSGRDTSHTAGALFRAWVVPISSKVGGRSSTTTSSSSDKGTSTSNTPLPLASENLKSVLYMVDYLHRYIFRNDHGKHTGNAAGAVQSADIQSMVALLLSIFVNHSKTLREHKLIPLAKQVSNKILTALSAIKGNEAHISQLSAALRSFN